MLKTIKKHHVVVRVSILRMLPLRYAEVFDNANALNKLEGFASFYGADFYGLPRNTDTITLEKMDWQVPDSYTFAGQKLIPLRAGEIVKWKRL